MAPWNGPNQVPYSNERSCRNSPEVTEPLDELGGVVLVEPDVGEVVLEDGRARISDVEEHELGLAQVHRRQRAGVLLTAPVKSSFDVHIHTSHNRLACTRNWKKISRECKPFHPSGVAKSSTSLNWLG